MTNGSASTRLKLPPPILVLGLGNLLMGDDGLGPVLLREVESFYGRHSEEVEFVDGGTQGLALLGRFAGRRAVVILDALARGTAGKVTVLDRNQVLELGASHATTAHEGNAGELLAVARLLGDLPEEVYVVGITPDQLQTHLGLSSAVLRSLHEARQRACEVIDYLMYETKVFA